MNIQALTLVAAVFAVSSCGGNGDAPDPSVLVYRPTGSLQCVGGGKSLEEIEGLAQSAGVQVRGGICAADGLAHVAACGTDDGTIAVLEIPQSQRQLALELGLSSAAGLPYIQIPCK
jgi:hypothetical protein